jgi:hypothetical protein
MSKDKKYEELNSLLEKGIEINDIEHPQLPFWFVWGRYLWLGRANRVRREAALVQFDEVIERFDDDPDPWVRLVVARAFMGRASALVMLKRREEALSTYRRGVAVFGDDEAPKMILVVVMMLMYLGDLLWALHQVDGATQSFTEVLQRTGHHLDDKYMKSFNDSAQSALRKIDKKRRRAEVRQRQL